MKRVLYIFDDVNYNSGANKISLYQIKMLHEIYDISVLTLTRPADAIKKEYPFINYIFNTTWDYSELLVTSLKEVLQNNEYSVSRKLKRIGFTILNRLQQESMVVKGVLPYNYHKVFESYDSIIIVSEASKLRKIIADTKGPKKIQWIHTDYCLWCKYSSWSRSQTKNDAKIYSKFDSIVMLTEISKSGFVKMFPQLEDKTKVIPNLIPCEKIKEKAKKECNITFDKKYFNIVTIGRIDKEKEISRIIEVCKKISNVTRRFRWYIVGDGPEYNNVKKKIVEYHLSDIVVMTGYTNNPYPILRQADLFALLSAYEGLPLTIYEALVLRIPVIATNVGGIREQLSEGKYGLLVDNNFESIYLGIKDIIVNPGLLENYKEEILDYKCCNEKIIDKIRNLI